jgi:endogenous inhibitor of DNA gyrase (YacG/DUF329 family)
MGEDSRVTYGRAHPDKTLAEVGQHFGQTREAVRQAFRRGGYIHPRHRRTAVTEARACYWPGCRKTFVWPANKIRRSCDTHLGRGRPKTAVLVSVTCDACGKTLTRTALNAKSRGRFFCDNECKGRWLGNNNKGRRSVRSGGPSETD